MDEQDLYEPLEEHASGPLGDNFARLWEEEVEKTNGKRTPSLLRVILKAYAARCMLYGFVLLLMECGIRARPLSPYFSLALLVCYPRARIRIFYSNFKSNANPRTLICEHGGRIPHMPPTPTTSSPSF
ncbi:Probable multidrug resistance-associated protein lethal(2)03659 [Eumeta japonica]|uniref:Probable multidrug resistance-associated protein lethal(2)03659 n=1 Tax=Eumeta variegata TaxID=151549 RepID=A0A4C1U9M6_EUMVA|nr:Probable multidrug resistance-associated protein lethal(2)03659 [Eumeta japonica]